MDTTQALTDELVKELDSDFFNIFTESIRNEILRFLLINGECDVGKIAQAFSQDRSVISRHLQMMFKANVLNQKRQGRFVFYTINGGAIITKLDRITNKIKECIAICCPV